MEEIKLPKFKTKEELEQFAMGLMTENESLREIIKRKDSSIEKMNRELFDSYKKNQMREDTLKGMKGILNEREKDVSKLKGVISELESEVQSLREKTNGDYYKKLYDTAFEDRWFYQIKFEKAEEMVHKLSTMVTFMCGLLNRFQAKRVYHAFGRFNAADYRL